MIRPIKQSLDFNENTIEIENFGSKWKAFGWNVIEINGKIILNIGIVTNGD